MLNLNIPKDTNSPNNSNEKTFTIQKEKGKDQIKITLQGEYELFFTEVKILNNSDTKDTVITEGVTQLLQIDDQEVYELYHWRKKWEINKSLLLKAKKNRFPLTDNNSTDDDPPPPLLIVKDKTIIIEKGEQIALKIDNILFSIDITTIY